jgi:hypothetical protein
MRTSSTRASQGLRSARLVRQYYTTPLGARSPHAGGHWLKTLTNLEELFVHYAPVPDPNSAERAMLNRFCVKVSEETREALFDPARPLPFANLDWPGRGAKRHGIRGSRAPKRGARVSAPRRAGGSGMAAGSQPTLHAELHRILCAHGDAWMTTDELADHVNAAARYRKRDGTAVTAFQGTGARRTTRPSSSATGVACARETAPRAPETQEPETR